MRYHKQTLAAILLTAAAATWPVQAARPVQAKQQAVPEIALGANVDLQGRSIFPPDNPWNTPVDKAPVDPNSDAIIATMRPNKPVHPDFGANWKGSPYGIPYVVVPATQRRVPVTFSYARQSDPGPYPIPPDAPIEGGPDSTRDRHILIVDRDNWKLYEIYDAHPQPDGSWKAGSGAIFYMNVNHDRPAGWTSADAAGLPILPGLARYDEVVGRKEINHALRFTTVKTAQAFVAPARHYASRRTDPNLPPMGMRVRLKAGFDFSKFPPTAQVILKALKKYGMILADNGSDWFISGAPDSRWNDDVLSTLKGVHGSDFEVVKMGPLQGAPR